MTNSFHNIKIRGMATVVPKNMEDNNLYAINRNSSLLKKQSVFTGIERRHVCTGMQTATDLCHKAANHIISHLKWSKMDIDVLVYVTQCPKFHVPSTAFLLHKRLGLKKDCIVFDVNLGCSGFNLGIQTVGALLQGMRSGSKGLLLLGDDIPNRITENDQWDEEAESLRILFGSAGSATAIEVAEQCDLYHLVRSDGNNYSAIIKRYNENLHMDGVQVFDYVIHDVVESVKAFLKHFKLSDPDIDYYIFHQAQKSIIDSLIDFCELSESKVPTSYREYGNTSGASLPLTICSHMEDMKKKKTVRLLMCGFGVGTSLGIQYTAMETRNLLPVLETDEYFDDMSGEWR